MSVSRFFTKDKAVMDSITNSGANADWYNNNLVIRIQDWDSLTLLQQTTMTTTLTAGGYQFDHDETV